MLELASLVALLRNIAREEPDARVTALSDSSVAKSALAKGRSTSRALTPALQRAAALQLAFGLYLAIGFAPTRLNTADAPTRFRELPERAAVAIHKAFTVDQCHALAVLKLSRPLASWARIFIVVTCVQRCGALSAAAFPVASEGSSPSSPFEPCDGEIARPSVHCGLLLICAAAVVLSCCLPLLGWFASRGPPFSEACRESNRRPACGAGRHLCSRLQVAKPFYPRRSFSRSPSPRLLSSTFLSLLSLCLTGSASLFGAGFVVRVVVLSSLARAMATPAPATPADARRAERRGPITLVADRIVRPVTRENRAKLALAFDTWLIRNERTSLSYLLDLPLGEAEAVAAALVKYGQYMFKSGVAYGKFSETINAVASLRPSLRRNLSAAWDLAFAWQAEEPHEHHKAMPKGILLAILATALAWGWLREAAALALGWTGLLRAGEIIGALRSDLILPEDCGPGVEYGILQIRSPKTRGRAARHQAVKLDPADVLKLLSLAFGKLHPNSRLWPFSAGTLRRPLCLLQQRLGLVHQGKVVFELSSLRPGGATFLLHLTESPDLVRRRGRWYGLQFFVVAGKGLFL